MPKKHTPEPWDWYAYPDGALHLGTPHSGHLIVMDFVRRGMQGALPRFAEWNGDERGRFGGIMRSATAEMMAAHPDARLIKYAPEMLKNLRAAMQALRSYQYGNASPELAQEIADAAEALIRRVEEGGA